MRPTTWMIRGNRTNPVTETLMEAPAAALAGNPREDAAMPTSRGMVAAAVSPSLNKEEDTVVDTTR